MSQQELGQKNHKTNPSEPKDLRNLKAMQSIYLELA